MLKLIKEFDKSMYSEENRIGTMRIDWADGYMCAKWFPTKLVDASYGLDLKAIDKELNEIYKEHVPTIESVIDLCKGTGFDNETTFFTEKSTCNFAIKLIPLKSEYSYVYIYRKKVQ